jgi:D-alanyl-D-alanine carboxypeptidase
MPVLVYENSFSSDNFSYSSDVANISSEIYLAADLGNNHAFTGKNTTVQVPIASITKLMTAIITTEYINLDNTVTVPSQAIVYTSKSRLQVGEKYRVYQLLFPLLMESTNEAAETIARAYGRSAFVKYMNDKAKAIGMTHTTFTDPSGADEGNVSTAEDLYMLAKYIYNSRSFVLDITSGKLKPNAYGDSGFKDLGNFNDFIDSEYFVGGKNGKTTAAQETNISIFNFPSNGTKRPVVLIVLKSENEKKDSERLLDFVLNNFKEVAFHQ